MQEITIAGFKGTFFPAKSNPKQTPVLFIHGAFADHTCFNKIASFFADNGYNAYAVSRRGRLGKPPDNASGLSFADYSQDTLTMIANIHPTPILIGHSLGGLLAMKAAEENQNIPAMVLIASAPPAMLTAQLIALPHFIPLLQKILLGKPIKPSRTAFKTLALQMLPSSEQGRIGDSLIHESGIVYRQMMLGRIRLKPYRKNVRTLVIGAMNDRIVSKALNRITARKTNAEYKEYLNHGHWIIEEAGVEQIANDILQWLDRTI